jgi:hypothetical protein
MSSPSPGDVTRLLSRWRAGNAAVLDQLIPLLYEELHGLAERSVRREPPDHTLQAIALVCEAHLDMAKAWLRAERARDVHA